MTDPVWDGVVEVSQTISAQVVKWKEVGKFTNIKEYMAIMIPLVRAKYATSIKIAANAERVRDDV